MSGNAKNTIILLLLGGPLFMGLPVSYSSSKNFVGATLFTATHKKERKNNDRSMSSNRLCNTMLSIIDPICQNVNYFADFADSNTKSGRSKSCVFFRQERENFVCKPTVWE